MFENIFEDKLAQLKEGDISELVIEQSEFLMFREIWKNLPDKADFIGDAGANGRIVYHYVKSNK